MSETKKHGTAIEWTHGVGFKGETWNPVTGCSKVSPGCAHCYAETLALTRLAGKRGYPGLPWTPENAAENIKLRPERLDQPLRWRRPRMVFVNSMSDLFHEEVPDSFIAAVWTRMARAQQHIFQILTKRPERMAELVPQLAILNGDWLPNVWLGVSIENRRYVHRADLLRATPAAVRFISVEPLLGNIADELFPNLLGYTPVNVGEEQEQRVGRLSGSGARRVGDPVGRHDLEGSRPSRDQGQAGQLTLNPLQAKTRGERDPEGLSPGPGDAQRREGLCDGAPTSMAAPARADTRGPDGEPRERDARRQLALELDADDGQGADAARSQRAGDGSRMPSGRGGEHGDKAHGVAGGGDSREARGGGATSVDRNRFRDCLPDGFEDRAGPAPISWVICGGESGPNHRPMDPQWARDLRDACQAAGVAYFFKQWGGRTPKAGGRLLDGRVWDEMPRRW